MRLSPGLFYGDLRKLFGDGFCFGVNSENLGLASEDRRLPGLVDFRLFYKAFLIHENVHFCIFAK